LAHDCRLNLEFHGSRVTTEAGLLAYRELDDALGLTGMVGDKFVDARTAKTAETQLRVFSGSLSSGLLGGYAEVNDAVV